MYNIFHIEIKLIDLVMSNSNHRPGECGIFYTYIYLFLKDDKLNLNYILNIELAITVDIPITAGDIWRTTVNSQMDIQDQMTVLLSKLSRKSEKKVYLINEN